MVPGGWISSAPWNALPADKVWACVADSLGKKRVAVKVSEYLWHCGILQLYESNVFQQNQSEIDQGPMRQSHSVIVYPEGVFVRSYSEFCCTHG